MAVSCKPPGKRGLGLGGCLWEAPGEKRPGSGLGLGGCLWEAPREKRLGSGLDLGGCFWEAPGEKRPGSGLGLGGSPSFDLGSGQGQVSGQGFGSGSDLGPCLSLGPEGGRSLGLCRAFGRSRAGAGAGAQHKSADSTFYQPDGPAGSASHLPNAGAAVNTPGGIMVRVCEHYSVIWVRLQCRRIWTLTGLGNDHAGQKVGARGEELGRAVNT